MYQSIIFSSMFSDGVATTILTRNKDACAFFIQQFLGHIVSAGLSCDLINLLGPSLFWSLIDDYEQIIKQISDFVLLIRSDANDVQVICSIGEKLISFFSQNLCEIGIFTFIVKF